MKRNWIKLWVDQCLRGSLIEELTPIQRWLWIGLLLMAGDSNIPGLIYRRLDERREPIGFSDVTIAELLDIPLSELQSGLKRLVETEKISINEKGVITIRNWKKYQSEYSRQEPYRRDSNESYKESCNQSYKNNCNQSYETELDIELDIERDKEREEDIYTKRECEGEGEDINSGELRKMPKASGDPHKSSTFKENRRKPKINFNYDLACWENITDKDMELWKEAYPAVDIGLCLSQMKNWIIDHPEKRKKNWRAFISRWLSREQERGGIRKPKGAGYMTNEELVARYEMSKKLKEQKK